MPSSTLGDDPVGGGRNRRRPPSPPCRRPSSPRARRPRRSGRSRGSRRAASSSARPATSGASGPTTTRSTCSSDRRGDQRRRRRRAAIGSTRATSAIPALPGAHSSSGRCGERASACRIACSRAPPPTTRTFGPDATRRNVTSGLRDFRHVPHSLEHDLAVDGVDLTVSPSTNRPSRIASASGSTSRFWITRLSGRAP